MSLKKKPEKFDMTINVLGPVGDSIEKWEIKNAKIIGVDFGALAWSGYNMNTKYELHYINQVTCHRGANPVEILATISYEVATLMY